jgi:hypothetical protein
MVKNKQKYFAFATVTASCCFASGAKFILILIFPAARYNFSRFASEAKLLLYNLFSLPALSTIDNATQNAHL